tara:strand:+ start:861 stop:1760 length:900 start_codon:yes stop_codon:yes gene_type:complete
MSNWNFFRLRMNINPTSTPAAWSIEDITSGTSADITSLINGSNVGGNTQPMVDPSGTKVYVPEFDNKKIRQLSLSSANDLTSTISNIGVSSALSYSFQNFQMSRNGNSAYMVDYAGNEINQYNLSTAWDITTMSTTAASSISYSVPSGNWVERGLHFNTDGTEVYHVISSYSSTPFAVKVQKYVLSTAYDLSTAATVDVIDITTSYDPQSDGGSPLNIVIIDDSSQVPYYLIFGPSSLDAAAYKNSVSNANVYENGVNYPVGTNSLHSCNDNNNGYYTKRSGSNTNYTWTLYQYNTNIT